MVVKKRYIFETSSTRYWRYIRLLLIIASTLFFLYISFCFVIFTVAENETEQTNATFVTQVPDLIVVFTGDMGRIPFAIMKAQEFKQSKILITGVYSKNTVKSILNNLKISGNLDIDPDQIEIDYLARNTVENVLSTLQYIKKNKITGKVVIISHDYHIMRIKMILSHLRPEDPKLEFCYTALKSNNSIFRNVGLLVKEGYKIIRALGFLILWDKDYSEAQEYINTQLTAPALGD